MTRAVTLALLFALLLPAGSGAAGSYEIAVSGAGIGVRADDAPLSAVLRALGAKMGFAVSIRGETELPPVTARFRIRDLNAALRSLIGDDATWLTFGDKSDGIPRELRVYPIAARAPGAPARAPPRGGLDENSRPYDPAVVPGNGRESLRELRALARDEPHTAVTVLAARMVAPDADATLRAVAVMALGTIGGADAMEAVYSSLGDPDPGVRRRAVQVLARRNDPGANRDIGDIALYDPDPRIRRAAVRALGRLSADDDTDALLWRATSDPDRGVRHMARRALAAR